MYLDKLDYVQLGSAPYFYHCDNCGLSNVKLWRKYQTTLDNQNLYCIDCLEQITGETLDFYESDTISWYVPAVPTEDGTSMWGYSSVPEAGCKWWDSLKTSLSAKKFIPGQNLPNDYYCHYCLETNRMLWIRLSNLPHQGLKQERVLICSNCVFRFYKATAHFKLSRLNASEYSTAIMAQFIPAIPLEMYENRKTTFVRHFKNIDPIVSNWLKSIPL